MEVVQDGQPVELALQVRTLLARLLLSAGQVVPSDALIEVLWDDDAGERSGTGIRVYVSRLRRVLEYALRFVPGFRELCPDTYGARTLRGLDRGLWSRRQELMIGRRHCSERCESPGRFIPHDVIVRRRYGPPSPQCIADPNAPVGSAAAEPGHIAVTRVLRWLSLIHI